MPKVTITKKIEHADHVLAVAAFQAAYPDQFKAYKGTPDQFALHCVDLYVLDIVNAHVKKTMVHEAELKFDKIKKDKI